MATPKIQLGVNGGKRGNQRIPATMKNPVLKEMLDRELQTIHEEVESRKGRRWRNDEGKPPPTKLVPVEASKVADISRSGLSQLEWKAAREWVYGNHKTTADAARACGMEGDSSNICRKFRRILERPHVAGVIGELNVELNAEMRLNHGFVAKAYMNLIQTLMDKRIGDVTLLREVLKDVVAFIGPKPHTMGGRDPREVAAVHPQLTMETAERMDVLFTYLKRQLPNQEAE